MRATAGQKAGLGNLLNYADLACAFWANTSSERRVLYGMAETDFTGGEAYADAAPAASHS